MTPSNNDSCRSLLISEPTESGHDPQSEEGDRAESGGVQEGRYLTLVGVVALQREVAASVRKSGIHTT